MKLIIVVLMRQDKIVAIQMLQRNRKRHKQNKKVTKLDKTMLKKIPPQSQKKNQICMNLQNKAV